MKSAKVRRESGREEARLTVPKKVAVEENLAPEKYWDDWNDHRDGMRDVRYREWKEREKKKGGLQLRKRMRGG